MAAATRPRAARWAPRAGAVVLAGGILAACGGGAAGGGLYGGGGGAASGGNQAATSTLSTRTVSGVGTVLVNGKGMTLYTPDQEAGGKIQCTDSCLSFWFPATAKKGAEPTVKGAMQSQLGTVQRSDNGKTQLTYKGGPLYTFKLDTKPGTAKGHNFSDSFDGTDFTWRAVVLKPAAGGSKQSGPGNGNGSGYGGGSNY